MASLKKISLTAFLDGFAMAGLFGRLRWEGAPTVAMAPSQEGLSGLRAYIDRLIAEAISNAARGTPLDEAERLRISGAVESRVRNTVLRHDPIT